MLPRFEPSGASRRRSASPASPDQRADRADRGRAATSASSSSPPPPGWPTSRQATGARRVVVMIGQEPQRFQRWSYPRRTACSTTTRCARQPPEPGWRCRSSLARPTTRRCVWWLPRTTTVGPQRWMTVWRLRSSAARTATVLPAPTWSAPSRRRCVNHDREGQQRRAATHHAGSTRGIVRRPRPRAARRMSLCPSCARSTRTATASAWRLMDARAWRYGLGMILTAPSCFF